MITLRRCADTLSSLWIKSYVKWLNINRLLTCHFSKMLSIFILNFLGFLTRPEERIESKRSFLDLFLIYILFFVWNIVTGLLTLFIFGFLLRSSIPLRSETLSDYSRFFFIIPCVLEEITFRLPLVRRKMTIWIALIAFSYYMASFITDTAYFSSDYLIKKIIMACILGTLLFHVLKDILLRADYSLYFYMICSLFAAMHLFNITSFDSPFVWFFASLYFINKLFGGVIFGYLRIKYGIVSSIVLHVLYDGVFML